MTMKRIFIAVLILFTVCFASAQQKKKTDSLITVLNSLPDNARRVPVLKQLSGQQNDAANIFKYGNEGLQLATKLGLQKDEEAFLAALAGGYFKTENYPKDLEISFKGLALSEKLMDTLYICRFLNGIGVSYDDANDPRKGLNYVLQGLRLAVKLKNKSRIEAFYVNIGDFYQDLNLLDSALYYEKVALRIAKEINDPNIGYPLIQCCLFGVWNPISYIIANQSLYHVKNHSFYAVLSSHKYLREILVQEARCAKCSG